MVTSAEIAGVRPVQIAFAQVPFAVAQVPFSRHEVPVAVAVSVPVTLTISLTFSLTFTVAVAVAVAIAAVWGRRLSCSVAVCVDDLALEVGRDVDLDLHVLPVVGQLDPPLLAQVLGDVGVLERDQAKAELVSVVVGGNGLFDLPILA